MSWEFEAQQGKVIVHCCMIVLRMRVNGRNLEPFAADGVLRTSGNDLDARRILVNDVVPDTMGGCQDPVVADNAAATEL